MFNRYRIFVEDGHTSRELVGSYDTLEEAQKRVAELERKKAVNMEMGNEAYKNHIKDLTWKIIDMGGNK